MTDPGTLARTAREYDAIPYLSKPFAESHPARLAGTARLLGLDPPPVATARVLELGGASGGNLIPFAAHHPEAQCRVIDISPRQVAEGAARVAALGLDNIAIDCASITDLDGGIGTFDYVIAHGVYSWVSAPVREALLRLMGMALAPHGVAYLSYNVLPGWRVAQPVRDAIRALVPDGLPEETRLRVARDLLGLASRHAMNTEAYGQQLRTTCDHLLARSDDYLFHDFLEHENEPFLFSEVLTAADRQGLGFLAEADLCTGFDENFGENFARDIRLRTGGEALPREALFDVLSGRTFRQTMLVRSEAASRVDRAIAPDRLEPLHLLIARGAGLAVEGREAKATSPHGLAFTLSGDTIATCVRHMLAVAPGSIPVAQCLRGLPAPERPRILRLLVRLVTAGVLVAVGAPMATGGAGARPVASLLARRDAASGNPRTTNARHESIWLDPEMAVLLPALDGTSDHAGLAALLVAAAADGRIALPDGITPEDGNALEAAMSGQVPVWLGGLAEMGLLEP